MAKLNIPKLIAHRGASAYAPENTLAAFTKAIQLGASWVEFDVRLSADNIPILFHDDTLNRTTNGQGIIANKNFAQLQALDAGSWFNSQYADEKILSFADLLQLAQQTKLGLNIEIKPNRQQQQQTVDAILSQLTDWPSDCPAPLISSFDLDCLYYLRKLDKTCQLGLLLNRWDPQWQQRADELNCCTVHLKSSIATQQRVQTIKATQRLVLCYTVNQIEQAKTLFSWGVDSIFSDMPDLLD